MMMQPAEVMCDLFQLADPWPKRWVLFADPIEKSLP